VLTKQAFVSRICQAMSPHLLMGMSPSACASRPMRMSRKIQSMTCQR
jgi:hypothetical protein